MGEEVVTVGCKLPNGLVIEVGYEVVTTDSKGVERTQFRKLPNYRRVALKGWHSNNSAGIQVVATATPQPGITHNVPKAIYDAWAKEHPELVDPVTGIVFVSKNENETKAKALDVAQIRSGLEALDPTKKMDNVTKAEFDKE